MMISLKNLFKSSDEAANLLPPLLSDSSLLLKNILAGLHSTRFAGKGENFWQYKEYTRGESVTQIDWRKSASSKKILIKQNEKELSKTIYLFFDKSFSMNYKSQLAKQSKLFFSALLTLTLSKLFSHSKEEVFIFNSENKPINCSNNNNFNENFLLNTNKHSLPNLNLFKDKSLCFFFSDFLYENNELKDLIIKFKKRGILGYLIQILDPMEINFKLGSNTMLKDLETNETMVIDSDTSFSNSYKKKLNELEETLKAICIKSRWKYSKFCTDQDIVKFLITLSKTIILNKQELA